MRENAYQNNSEYRHFSRTVLFFLVYSEILSRRDLSQLLEWFGETAVYSEFNACIRYKSFPSRSRSQISTEKLRRCLNEANHLTIIRGEDNKKIGYFYSRFSSKSFLFEFGNSTNNMTVTSSTFLSCFKSSRWYLNCGQYQFRIETTAERYSSTYRMKYSTSIFGEGTVAYLEVFNKVSQRSFI